MKIASITISFNPDLDVLNKQLLSLKEQVDKVIVIDNCSKNISSIKEIVESIDKAFLISLNENIGIAAAQNEGIKLAKTQGCTDVVLFDHDSDVPKGFINGLLGVRTELSNSGEKVGAIGPTFSDAATMELYPVAKFKSNSKYSGFSLQRIRLNTENYLSEVYLLIASGCLISMDVIDDVGMMDGELFIDNVDLEWCYRARSHGYKVFATSRAHLMHRIGEGSRTFFGRKVSIHSNIRKYYNIRNNLQLLRYNYVPLGAKFRAIVYVFLSFLIGIIDTNDKKQYVKFHVFAFRDFFKAKLGKLDSNKEFH